MERTKFHIEFNFIACVGGEDVFLTKKVCDVPFLPPVGMDIRFRSWCKLPETADLKVAYYGRALEQGDGSFIYEVYVQVEDSIPTLTETELTSYTTDGWVIDPHRAKTLS